MPQLSCAVSVITSGMSKSGSVIAVDSNVFIAALSSKETHSVIAQQIMRSIAQGEYRAITSSIAYGEVLSISRDIRNTLDLESFFASLENLSIISASDAICLKAGQLRKTHGSSLKLPDALHLATALIGVVGGAELFVTNDGPLAKIAAKVMPIKTLADW